ncbi:cytosolic Fe-S cluster assembly factor NUBP2 isoform X1 [Ursus maritimus]|uniref:Cytosolic Fe-S cluster assembly factor NUBP2 n=1 Tax=Ursus maritimus TaxID=29073 RepID=A0A8M1G9G5_URSMA|nr:cytosolic Fe-S cluster assembly factor NUBP2 isoform X1 [Ursus maritimus]XP_057171510.1 cytosolic Fe-S cluster assembly factor NUBP2 isoform X1 [Ursus arctos]
MEAAAAEPGNLAGVRHIILVLSGKGGVGKSTISTELALALRHAGKKVGILDVDLCGPSIPRMLRAQGRAVHQCDSGWVPVFVDQEQSISLMSVGFLLESPDEAVVWRGPKKNGSRLVQGLHAGRADAAWALQVTCAAEAGALIKQFVSDVAWGQLDYLVVDTPPGTSDEHMATVEALRPYSPLGALVVTTPQVVSVGDVRRELTFCRKTGLQVVGVVENMSGFVCPHCAECTNVFSRGGGEELARLAGVPFLGSVPLDPELTRSLEEGRDFIRDFPNSPAFPALSSIAQKVLSQAPARLS